MIARVNRYILLAIVLFLSVYLFRLWQMSNQAAGLLEVKDCSLNSPDKQLQTISIINRYKCGELKGNVYLRICGEIDSIPLAKSGWQSFKVGKILVKTSKNEDYFLGDRVKVVGKPELRVTNKFFKQIYLINPEIIKYKNLTKNEQKCFGKGVFLGNNLLIKLKEFTYLFRRRALEVYLKILPEPQASLLSGIVLGTSELMDWKFWQALKKTGTLHIVAASGMNVALVAKIIIDVLIKFISRRKSYFISLVIIIIYCLLAGASPSVVRAGLMASLAFLALAFGREASGGWLLFLAAAIMLLTNPLILFDTGFQLSVCAMAGMIYIKPILVAATCQQNLSTTSFSLITTTFLDTLSAQLATFPILYFTFGQVQSLSFLPNLFVLPVVPLVMILGFIILVCGLIYLPLAYPITWLTWPILTYFVKVIEWWGKIL